MTCGTWYWPRPRRRAGAQQSAPSARRHQHRQHRRQRRQYRWPAPVPVKMASRGVWVGVQNRFACVVARANHARRQRMRWTGIRKGCPCWLSSHYRGQTWAAVVRPDTTRAARAMTRAYPSVSGSSTPSLNPSVIFSAPALAPPPFASPAAAPGEEGKMKRERGALRTRTSDGGGRGKPEGTG